MGICRTLVLGAAFFSFGCLAKPENNQVDLEMEKQLERLKKVNFHPNLLPIILRNSDFMGLSPEQVAAFKAWGKNKL